MNFKSVLSEVQSISLNLIKNSDLETIQGLDKYLENIINKEKELNEPISVLNDLKEYIIFPLIITLKKKRVNSKRHELLLENILKCFEKILSNSLSVDWNFYKDVLLVLFLCITSPQNPQIVASVSEDVKTSVLQNVIYLCKALPSEHWDKFTSLAFRAQLGHAIYICLEIAEKEKHHILRVKALNALLELGLRHRSNQFDIDIMCKLGFAFANFLPGITITTTRIAMGGEIQGHKITVAALSCWEYFVFVVMRDRFLSTIVEDVGAPQSLDSLQKKLFPSCKTSVGNLATKEKFTSSNDTQDESNAPQLKNITIDCDWIEMTSKRLSELMETILSLVSYSHWKVREALVHICHSVFQYCNRSMNSCVVLCLEALVTLKSDLVLEVSFLATDALHLLKDNFDSNDDGNLLEFLEERVFALVTKFPSIIKCQDDMKLLSSVRQLHGSLEVLEERIRVLVQLPFHLHRLLRAFLLLYTYDYSDSDLLLEKTLSEDPFEVVAIKSRLGASFRYFRSNSIMECSAACCGMLGRHGDVVLIVDHCLDLIKEGTSHCNEALLLLHLIINGAVNLSNETLRLTSEEREQVIECIVDVLLNQNIFEVPIRVTQRKNLDGSSTEEDSFSALLSFHSFKLSPSVDMAKRNVIRVSNALRLIGTCASFLERGFDVFLNRVLYSLLEKAGDNNVLIVYSALVTLEKVTTACGHKSVSDLIEKSLPFFWFTLCQKLKRLSDFPSSPQVLIVTLRCQKGKVKAFVEDLVEDMLDSLDAFHAHCFLPLLTVLFSFVNALAGTYVSDTEQQETLTEQLQGSNSYIKSRLYSFIEEIHNSHEAMERELKKVVIEQKFLSGEEGFRKHLEEQETVLNDEQNQAGSEESNEMVPKQIDLIVRILERCSYLLFIKDHKAQLVILQIIKCCFHILQDWENKKLPCFHKIWKPLLLLLKGKDYIVLLKALEICVLMVQGSGDFLRKRFLKEIFPHLLFFLESQTSASLNKTGKTGYYLTPAFKAQCHVLENISTLWRRMQLDVIESGELLCVIMMYLDDRQPPLLDKVAFEALNTIKEYHPDLAWLTIASSKGTFQIPSPSPLLNSILIDGVKMDHLCEKVLRLYEELS